MFDDVKDSDVYDYRKSKLVKNGKHYRQLLASDRSTKRSIRTSIGFIDIYIYYPQKQLTNSVYFNMHGGGMVLGFFEEDIPYCELLSKTSGAIIVNIDYCLAPEYKFPITYQTTYEVLKYCNLHRDEFDFGNAKFIVGGNSAGGQIAGAVVQLEKQDNQKFISGLVMNYAPCTQQIRENDVIDPSKAISMDRIHQYQAWEYNSRKDFNSPLVNLTQADSKIYPTTLINSAEYDSLRPGEEKFVSNLQKVNVKVDYRCFPKCQHGFTHKDLKEYNPTQAKIAWDRIAKFITEIGKE